MKIAFIARLAVVDASIRTGFRGIQRDVSTGWEIRQTASILPA
jgi:hypothetical protein